MQEISLCESSDLLVNAYQPERVRSSAHSDMCLSNRRYVPDIYKSVVQFATPQTLYSEIQICQDTQINIPAARCFTDLAQIQYSHATIEVVCSMKFQQSSDAKRVSTAGFRTGINTGGPHPVTTFATRLMCDARERNMPWDPGIRVC